MSTLLRFMERLVVENGGAVEWDPGRSRFQAVVPEEVRRALGLPADLVTINDGMDEPHGNAFSAGYGTEILDRALSFALERGRTAAVQMEPVRHRKPISERIHRHFVPLNVVFRLQGEQESWRDYWLFSFATVAEADDRREGVSHVVVSSEGVECGGLAPLVLGRAADWEPIHPGPAHELEGKLAGLCLVAVHRALARVREDIDPFVRGVARRHGRDIVRIRAYFGDLHDEMEEEIQRRGLTGEALTIRREKQGQLAREESGKLAALEEKYRMRLTIRPRSLLLARLPVKRCDLSLKRRKKERRISVAYNLLSKRFDPLHCEACGQDTFQVGCCDDRLHLLCGSCLDEITGRGKRDCPRCRGKRPAGDVAEVIRRLGMTPAVEEAKAEEAKVEEAKAEEAKAEEAEAER